VRENAHRVPDEVPNGVECTPLNVSDRSSEPTLNFSQANVCSLSRRSMPYLPVFARVRQTRTVPPYRCER
jgi:hypothetical protein